MRQFLLNTDEYRRWYNCTSYKVDVIPLERRQNIPVGVFLITVGLIETVNVSVINDF